LKKEDATPRWKFERFAMRIRADGPVHPVRILSARIRVISGFFANCQSVRAVQVGRAAMIRLHPMEISPAGLVSMVAGPFLVG
jgi:hypothetical protein